MSKRDYFILAAFVVACWMFRWEAVVSQDGNGYVYMKHRITGEVRLYATGAWMRVEESK